MKFKNSIYLSIFLISSIFSFCYAENELKQFDNPRQLVEFYCKADFEGVFLSSENYKKSNIGKFIIRGEYMSPAWDTVVLIKDYKIQEEKQNNNNSSISVNYDVIGYCSRDVTIKRKNELYVFRLKKQNNQWVLIEPYDLPQHISIETAIKHFKSLEKTQGNTDSYIKPVLKKLNELQVEFNKTI
jgi:hypothetical protein